MKIILIFLLVTAVLGMIFIYNRIIRLRNTVNDAWSNIDVFLKKRYELVPILVSTVKAYAKHEESTLTQVSKARQNAMNLPDFAVEDRTIAEKKLNFSLNNIFILQESYPDLKANNAFLKLQLELGEIEQDLERSRRYYNATVRENNTFGERFPANIFAQFMGHKKCVYFAINANETEPQKLPL